MKRLFHSITARITALCTACLCLFAGCAPDHTIRIGTATAMQDQILAWMVCELAERQGLEAEVCAVSDGIVDLQPALESGSLQAGIEFSQSAWTFVLKEKEPYSPADLTVLQREYEKKRLTWISLPMVIDHYTLAVSRLLASQYHLKTLSDLKKVSGQLTLGGPTAFFDREDGLPRFMRAYDLDFATTVNLPEDGVIEALRKGKVDVVPVHSLDGDLLRSAVVILEDDQSAYEDSTAGIVLGEDMIRQNPSMAQVARKVAGALSSDQLTFYARLCARDVCTPQEAALVLLKAAGLVTEDPGSAQGNGFLQNMDE